jgi:hypothetical protein
MESLWNPDMNRLIIPLDDEQLTVSMEDAVPAGDRMWGVIGIRLVDEWTRQPPRTKVSASTEYAGLSVHVSDDGAVGLAGIPRLAFPELDTNNYTVDLTIRALGYVTQKISASIPMQWNFPTSFSPTIMPDLYLHRLPVAICGRTVLSAAGATTSVAGATVRVVGMWRTPPPANAIVPADPPNLACLEPPVYAERKAASGILRRCDLTPVLLDKKLLLEPCSPGSEKIRLSNRQNLNIGDILQLDAEQPDRQEHIPIHSIAGGSTPDQEAEITLEQPTAGAHRKNAVVLRVTAAPPGAANLLADGAIPGDTTVFPGGLVGLAGAEFARLEDGPAQPEYHRVRLYSAVSDADGYYRMPPVSRTAWLELEADDGVHTPVKLVFSPDYEQSENVVDFVFA